MPRKLNLYVGRAGQMAVMAEFLVRGYNVAVPEVDIGDDIFVVRDRDGEYSRIQVKSALATRTTGGYSARYALKFTQLQSPTSPETWFVFANRFADRWDSFLVISRPELSNLYLQNSFGSLNRNNMLSLYLSYAGPLVICSGQGFSQFLNNWRAWPEVKHDLS